MLYGLPLSLRKLDLSSNNLNTVPFFMADSLTLVDLNVTWLSLRANHITYIQQGTFGTLSKLTYLDLSELHHLRGISLGAMNGLTSLQVSPLLFLFPKSIAPAAG